MSLPRDSLLIDRPLRERQVLHVPQGATADFTLQLRDWTTGDPVVIPDTATVAAQFIATYRWGGTTSIFDVEAAVSDRSIGQFMASLAAADTELAGMWTAVLVVQIDGAVRYTQPYYIEIEPHDLYQSGGPITIGEVRLHLRDTDPEANYLLDALEFTDGEIAAAVRWPIDYFNEQPPPLTQWWGVDTFPYRAHWLDATVGRLFLTAALKYRRDKLRYSTGSSQIDPEGTKGDDYERYGRLRLEEFKAWVLDAKITHNVMGGFGGITSQYGRLGST